MAYPPRQPASSSGSQGRSASSSLQTRLCGPRGVASLTVQVQPPYDNEKEASQERQKEPANQVVGQAPSPSRWNTPEFYLYALVFIMIVPWMCWVPIRLSLESNRNFPRYSSHLTSGWLFGRLRDDSDFQYKGFRDYFPILTVVLLVYLALSHLSERLANDIPYQLMNGSLSRPNRVSFLTIFTSIFVLALHGTNTLKLIFVCTCNYLIVKSIASTPFKPITPLAVWTWNVGILFAVHWNAGFAYEGISSSLAWLDKYNGLLPRWQINFNITMLRLISFSMDYFWAKEQQQGDNIGDEAHSGKISDPRSRQETPLHITSYSYHAYLLYALYPPLFIAGPIMTFNDFTRQLQSPLAVSSKYTIQYAIRLAATILTMEFILHFMYVNAIKDSKAWQGATPMELSMIGFWNLIVVWLKLLIPWRFFRLWALADRVDAPENMVRCMANNYSTLGFWRSWHRSYNLWIVRYIYIPLGGSGNAIAATLLVFTFVALWHDLSLKLLTWGWLVTLFILPEITARKVVPKQRYGAYWWYRHICAVGGVINVLMMMSANLVGFAIGTDGMAYMCQQLLSNWKGLQFMVAAFAVLFVGVQVMFEYREEEMRRGIVRKC